MRGRQLVNRRRPMKSKKSDNKKFAEKIICICGRRFSYVGGLTYHKKVSELPSKLYCFFKLITKFLSFFKKKKKKSGNVESD